MIQAHIHMQNGSSHSSLVLHSGLTYSMIRLIHSLVLSTQSRALLSPAYTQTGRCIPALPLTITVLFIFYSILLCYCRSCVLLSHSLSQSFSLPLCSPRVCSVRFKSLVQFDFLQVANTPRTIRVCIN